MEHWKAYRNPLQRSPSAEHFLQLEDNRLITRHDPTTPELGGLAESCRVRDDDQVTDLEETRRRFDCRDGLLPTNELRLVGNLCAKSCAEKQKENKEPKKVHRLISDAEATPLIDEDIMRGLHLDQGTLRYREDLPEPEAESVRVQVLRAGICATDLALARGYMGFSGIPGHEFVGLATEGRFAGSRVTGEINAACGDCSYCKKGLQRHCPSRSVLGILGHSGAFAEYLHLPEKNLHPVPDAISTDAATFTEPLAAAFEIQEQVQLDPGMRALVVGDGKLGLLCASVLRLRGLDVTLAGRHPERVERLPAGVTAKPELSEGSPLRYDLVVEATGSAEVLPKLLQMVEPCGTLVLKTTTEKPYQIDLAAVVIDEITLLGSRCGPFAPAIDCLGSGQIDVESLIDARYPLADGVAAFARAGQRGTLKVLLDISSE